MTAPSIVISRGVHRQREVERVSTINVKTKGPFVNWPFTKPRPPDDQAVQFTLIELTDSLRKQSGNMPLTVLIHGWGSKSSKHFFDSLEALLESEDAIWLLPLEDEEEVETVKAEVEITYRSGGKPESDSSLIDKAIVLNIAGDPDSRIYDNLVGDIVFFPGLADDEKNQLAKFSQRARVVLVDREGGRAKTISDNCVDVVVCEWQGEKTRPAADVSTTEPATQQNAETIELLDKIGTTLTEFVEYYDQGGFGRRPYLRTEIKSIEDEYPELSELYEGLIRQAHKHEWPVWAIECLPRFYVPLEDNLNTALVWHLVLKCTPERHRPTLRKELCKGAFFEVELQKESKVLFETVARIFEEHLSSFPYASEKSFKLGAINNALQVIEMWLDDNSYNEGQEVKKLRMALLKEGQIVQD